MQNNLDTQGDMVTTSMPSPQLTHQGKISGSKQIVKESWNILKQDKEIIWFPILSIISSLIFLMILGTIFFTVTLHGFANESQLDTEETWGSVGYLYLFIYYIISFFIVIFFQTGILIIVDGRINGKDLNLKDGLRGARENFGKLFLWSVITGTVGMILDALVNNSKILGKIVGWILGTAWAVLTYFSLPSLIIGKKSVKESFKDSASLIKTTWGETFAVNFSVGLYFLIIILGVIALGGIIIALVPYVYLQFFIAILIAVFIFAMIIVSAALSVIFKLALYEYARTGKIIEGFSEKVIRNAVKTKKR